MRKEIHIFDAVRTPLAKGDHTGKLYEVKPLYLIKVLLDALKKRNAIKEEDIDKFILGCVTPMIDQGANIAKSALLFSGWSDSITGYQLNSFSISGAEAIHTAIVHAQSDWSEKLYLAGGIESTSRVPIGGDGGALFFAPEMIAKAGQIPKGVSADLIATLEGIDTTAANNYAIKSLKRTQIAQASAFYNDSVIPVEDKIGLPILLSDEHQIDEDDLQFAQEALFQKAEDIGYDALAILKYPQVDSINHIHTQISSATHADGASILLIGAAAVGKKQGLKPRAKVLMSVISCTEPTIKLLGGIKAAETALTKANLSKDDIDIWEISELFAGVVLKYQKYFNIDDEKMNISGGELALGHAPGAASAILLTKLLDELESQNKNIGIAISYAGAGLGAAIIIERLS